MLLLWPPLSFLSFLSHEGLNPQVIKVQGFKVAHKGMQPEKEVGEKNIKRSHSQEMSSLED